MRTIGPAHAETKQRILTVARQLVLKHGHGGLSLRAIARAMGFSAPSLYEYFDRKEAIIEAIAGQITGSLRVAMQRAVDGARDPRAGLVALGAGYVAWAKRHPQDFMLMFSRLPSKRRSLNAGGGADSPYMLVIQAARAAQASGVLGPKADAETVAYAIWAAAHGMAMLQLTHLAGFDADFEAADRATLEAIVAGFA